jgi:hypothetical protein
VDGELTQNDVKDRVRTNSYCRTYKFKMVEGKVYQIDLRSNDFDSYLRLENPAGTQVASDDDSGGFPNARINYAASQTGEFTIICTSFAANAKGKFELTILEKAKEPAPARKGIVLEFAKGKKIADAAAVLGKDDPPYRANRPGKRFLINLDAGKSYQIDMKSRAFDSMLYLLDPDGMQVASDDDSGGNLDARIIYRPTKTGQYQIISTYYGFAGGGEFTLTVEQKTETPQKKQP